MTNGEHAIGVRVSRSGRWWAIEVPSMPGVFSQCRRLEQVDEFVREAIALAIDRRPDQVGELSVEIDPPAEAESLVSDAVDAAARARHAAAEAADARLAAARRLRDLGYPTRDIGVLLDISHQRVSQLLAAG